MNNGYYVGDTRTRFINTTVKQGVGFGSCLAIVVSYTAHKSILWAIIHGLMGWVYVLYYALMY